MPSRADIDPAEMVPFLPHVILVDVLRHEAAMPLPLDFRYRLLGTGVEAHMNDRYTGRRLSDLPHQRAPSRVWSKLVELTETRLPVYSHVPYVGRHKDFMAAQDLMMPLGLSDGIVRMAFIIVDFVPKPSDVE